MMKVLFRQQGSQFSVDILADDKVQNFIEAHAGVLDSAFEKVEMSDSMRRRLTRSNYIFSGMKTFHELNEAFPSIVDENGERKSFERFLNDVCKIDKTYNSNYLRAEYNFVVSSATMAAKSKRRSRTIILTPFAVATTALSQRGRRLLQKYLFLKTTFVLHVFLYNNANETERQS